jgi:two-component system, LuxR family, sensor kinase FixL
VTQHARTNPDAQKRIAIAASATDEWLEVSVTDTGTGFPAELQRKIFSAGFTTKPKGHGYGLHSSALAADQLGGTLSCSSPGPGLGASFVLRVPAKSHRDSRPIDPTNVRPNEPKAYS